MRYPLNERFIEPELRRKHRISWFRDELKKVQGEGYYESVIGEKQIIEAELAALGESDVKSS